MSSIISSISRQGTYEPFELQVSRNQIAGHRNLRINAYNLAADTSIATVWPKNIAYVFPPSATIMKVSSSSTADTTQSVLIQGLDANYVEIQEVVFLNGQTAVNTVNSYLRINKMQVLVDSPVGNISIGVGVVTAGVPATTYGYIAATDGFSQSTVYTIPAGYTLYVTQNVVIVGGLASQDNINVDFRIKGVNGVNYLISKITQGNASNIMVLSPPVALPEKSDIYANAIASAGNGVVSIALSGMLIKNDGQA